MRQTSHGKRYFRGCATATVLCFAVVTLVSGCAPSPFRIRSGNEHRLPIADFGYGKFPAPDTGAIEQPMDIKRNGAQTALYLWYGEQFDSTVPRRLVAVRADGSTTNMVVPGDPGGVSLNDDLKVVASRETDPFAYRFADGTVLVPQTNRVVLASGDEYSWQELPVFDPSGTYFTWLTGKTLEVRCTDRPTDVLARVDMADDVRQGMVKGLFATDEAVHLFIPDCGLRWIRYRKTEGGLSLEDDKTISFDWSFRKLLDMDTQNECLLFNRYWDVPLDFLNNLQVLDLKSGNIIEKITSKTCWAFFMKSCPISWR